MTDFEELLEEPIHRRRFLESLLEVATASAVLPIATCSRPGVARATTVPGDAVPAARTISERAPRIPVTDDAGTSTLLKDGLIVDGTGQKAFTGDLLVRGEAIEIITPGEILFKGPTVDCSGKVVAPGFIDMHSHMDWVLPLRGHPRLSTPFTAQGVTTFVAGNCGFGVAGFKRNSPFRAMISGRAKGMYELHWDTMGPYFDFLRTQGLSHNLVNLAGHGTTRTSIRGYEPTPMQSEEMKELLYLLEESMDQGAFGVSLGLQYEPGIFATADELRQIAELVKRKDKILTVHLKAYSSLSGTYPLAFFGRPHNLLAIEDMLTLARETGVRLQISHLIFVGSGTWDTCEEALELIDEAIEDGLDVKFDTYAYHCGTSVINVVLPEWFLAKIPEAFESRVSLLRLRAEITLIEKLLGFGYRDIQITDTRHPSLEQYNGMFLNDIAAERDMSPFENFLDLAQKSEGRARVLNHRYSSLDNLKLMMRHPASLFMTDATPAPSGVQNPATYGNFPRFFQYAREFGLLGLEDCVHKMTGASARRFGLRKRGLLEKGAAADISIFDWNLVRDNNTGTVTDRKPTGIEHVFINGRRVMTEGRVEAGALAGKVL
jgi:N-acyl-D-amino-acid deacylase